MSFKEAFSSSKEARASNLIPNSAAIFTLVAISFCSFVLLRFKAPSRFLSSLDSNTRLALAAFLRASRCAFLKACEFSLIPLSPNEARVLIKALAAPLEPPISIARISLVRTRKVRDSVFMALVTREALFSLSSRIWVPDVSSAKERILKPNSVISPTKRFLSSLSVAFLRSSLSASRSAIAVRSSCFFSSIAASAISSPCVKELTVVTFLSTLIPCLSCFFSKALRLRRSAIRAFNSITNPIRRLSALIFSVLPL